MILCSHSPRALIDGNINTSTVLVHVDCDLLQFQEIVVDKVLSLLVVTGRSSGSATIDLLRADSTKNPELSAPRMFCPNNNTWLLFAHDNQSRRTGIGNARIFARIWLRPASATVFG